MDRDQILSLRDVARLLFNHMDAWGPALIISGLALLAHDAVRLETLAIALAIGVGYWLAFAVNDYYDAPYDAAEPAKARRNFFLRAPFSRRQVRLTLWAIGLGLVVFFLRFGWHGAAVAGVSVLVMWGYSAPPLRFKSRPGLDLLVHALFVETFPYLVTLFLINTAWTRLDAVLLTILFLASLSAQLEQQLRDFGVDSRTDRNFTTTVGKTAATYLLKGVTAVLVLVAVVFTANGTIPLFIAAFGLIAGPAILHRFLRGREKPRSERLVFASALAGLLYTGAVFAYAYLW